MKIHEKKRRVDERSGKKIFQNLSENIKQFWEEVNNMRRVREQTSEVIQGKSEVLEGREEKKVG